MSPGLCIALVLMAGVLTFLGFYFARAKLGATPAWAASRNRSSGAFIRYLGAFVWAMFITFICSDWMAISLIHLENTNYLLAERMGYASTFAVFCTAFFGFSSMDKPSRMHLVLLLFSAAGLLVCVGTIHTLSK